MTVREAVAAATDEQLRNYRRNFEAGRVTGVAQSRTCPATSFLYDSSKKYTVEVSKAIRAYENMQENKHLWWIFDGARNQDRRPSAATWKLDGFGGFGTTQAKYRQELYEMVKAEELLRAEKPTKKAKKAVAVSYHFVVSKAKIGAAFCLGIVAAFVGAAFR